MRMDQEPDIGPEPIEPPTQEEERAEAWAWEYWHQRALKAEAALAALAAVARKKPPFWDGPWRGEE